MQKLVVFFLCISSFNVQAEQQADSLLTILPRVHGDEKAQVLNQLSVCYQENDSALSLSYARQALALALESGNKAEMSSACYNIADCLYYFNRYSPALGYYDKALEIWKALGDDIHMGEVYNAIALVHFYTNEFDLAIENLIEALRCLRNTNAENVVARVYSNMAMVYSQLQDYRKSVYYYKKAVAINEKIGHVTGASVNYNGLGVIYFEMDKLDSSRISYQIALRGFRSVKDRRKEAVTLNNIANVMINEGDSLQKALEYFQEALAVLEELNDNEGRTFILASMGAAYRIMGNTVKALEILRRGLELAQKNRLGFYIHQNIYNEISRTCEKMGRVEEAFAAYKLHRAYLDSLRDGEKIRQVAELEKKFESEKREEEILRLNTEKEIARLQIERERTIRIFIMAALLLTFGITAYFSYGYFRKKKTNMILKQKNEQIECQRNELEKMNATKNRFFSILAHDLKNPFHTILGYSSLLNGDYDRFTEEERKKYAGDIYKSAHNIFRLLQNLLDWSRSQTGSLSYRPVKFDVHDLTESVYGLLKPMANQKDIGLINQISPETYLFADLMMIETILRNLVANAIKFSYPGGKVTIRGVPDGAGQLTLCVNDNGRGLSEEEINQLFLIDSRMRRKGTKGEEGSGLGLPLCSEFVRINKGTIRVESELEKGSSFYVTVPSAPFGSAS